MDFMFYFSAHSCSFNGLKYFNKKENITNDMGKRLCKRLIHALENYLGLGSCGGVCIWWGVE